MKITLLNLPWRSHDAYGVRAGSRWPFTSRPGRDGYIRYIPFPFFLAYATALLKKNGYNTKLIDAIAARMSKEEMIKEIISYSPDLIVFETSTPSFLNDIVAIKNIHEKFPDCRIALCGPHATIFHKEILNKHAFIDYILIGEYEFILLDLINHLEAGLDLTSVLGLAYRDNSRVRINKSRPTIKNLDSLPWPERDTLPMYNYNDGFAGLPEPNVQMWTSRGCPFQCIFCLWPQTVYVEHRYRKRDPFDVVDEMEYLVKRYNFKAVYFDDDVINIDKQHVLNICNEIKKQKINIPWAAMARADLMDEGLLYSMSDAGLFAIKYGIESANQKILNLCKKKLNLKKAIKMIQLTKKVGVKTHLTFCLGLPGETRKSIQETVNFIKITHPNSLQFSIATPFPGTEYFRYLEQIGDLLSDDYSDYDGNSKCIVRTGALSNEELIEVKNVLSNHFNLQ